MTGAPALRDATALVTGGGSGIGRACALALAAQGAAVAVNNAGVNVRRPAFEVTEEDWDVVLDVNLRGVFSVAQAAGRVMRDQRPPGGAIVNMASIMGLVAYPERAAYRAGKAAVVNLTRALAVEWAGHGIRVNAVCPTFVDTPLTRPLFEARPDFAADVVQRTPLGRLATPTRWRRRSSSSQARARRWCTAMHWPWTAAGRRWRGWGRGALDPCGHRL